MDPREHVQRRFAPSINTSDVGGLPQGRDARRFSYTDTPIDARQPVFGLPQPYRRDQPTLNAAGAFINSGQLDGYHIQNSTSPLSTSNKTSLGPNTAAPTPDSAGTQQTWSPYSVSNSQQTLPSHAQQASSGGIQTGSSTPPSQQVSQPDRHTPASYLTQTQTPNPQRASTIPMNSEYDARKSAQPLGSPTKSAPVQPDLVEIPYIPHSLSSTTQPRFVPDASTGPNGMTPDMHQPGQVAHPNMQNVSGSTSDKDPFWHSLCECNADVGTCLTGVFCPCILDSKTAYRMGRRSEKRDPTEMLGFSSCNGRCGAMAVFGVCGLCCIFPLTVRTRIRHAYKLQGSFANDVLQSCYCCCCVAIQNEREVRDREERIRQNAGPVSQYRRDTMQMAYTPGGT